MTRGRRGSDYTPDPDTADRLIIWRRGAEQGIPVAEIAAQLGISRDALDRFVCRARARGHPDAVRHALAGPPPGEGFVHLLDPHRSHQTRRRQLRQAAARSPT